MASNVIVCKDEVNGVWIDGENENEVAIYIERNKGVVLCRYTKKNESNVEIAVMFNPDGTVVLQELEASSFLFSKLNPTKVAVELDKFLKSLANCRE